MADQNQKAEIFELNNGTMRVFITNYGCTITSLSVPGKDGKLADVVLGFDSVDPYMQGLAPYFGCIVGRVANRIKDGKFTLNGTDYSLPVNRPPNSLHGGHKGYDKQIWEVAEHKKGDNGSITFKYHSRDGEEGYPGNLSLTATYTLTSTTSMRLDMEAVPENKPTPVSLAQHTYWNLAGHNSGSILDHAIQIWANHVTPVDENTVPTGEIEPVKGTPFDFTAQKRIGESIHEVGIGYDHNYVLDCGEEKEGLNQTATKLFEEIPSPDLVAWNTIIDSHVNCGKCKEALDLFLRLLQSGVEPDEATVVVTLSACSTLGALDFGRWVHSCIDQVNLGDIVTVSNSLIDMYAKCGAFEEAYETFSKMEGKNIVSWNTIILGLATHGHEDDALELFSKMLEEKLEIPDGVTFLGVLCACSHGGMVDEGRRYFDVMSKEYHIQPTMKHYGCMVDMLGRAGYVEEAYNLIRSMPMECNAIVWRTLLAACQVHSDVELGEKVRSHLLELEPDQGHSSDYVLLANMYASVGQWNEVMSVRKSMKDRGVQKPEPGNSLVGAYSHMI